jgi:toxin ParE1/3/4
LRIVFTPLAERRIGKLYDDIAGRASEKVADGYIGRILFFCESLKTFPLRGTARDDLLPGLRTIGFERRVTIAFVVTTKFVLIEGVFYGGQDFEASFKE